MSCETLGASESGNSGGGLGAQVRAIKYAADNGAVICQNSWGYTAGAISENDWTRGNYSALADAIHYFVKYAGLDENGDQEGPMAGGLVIFAAGNDASDEICYHAPKVSQDIIRTPSPLPEPPAMPFTPIPLLFTAAMVPATCVPCMFSDENVRFPLLSVKL